VPMIAAIYARKSTDQNGRGDPMSVEIVMTRESFDCLEKLIPKEVSEGMQAPVFLQASGTTPHQVVLTCSLEIAEKLLEIARPSCGPAAEDIRSPRRSR
jgi:hypothetical protein